MSFVVVPITLGLFLLIAYLATLGTRYLIEKRKLNEKPRSDSRPNDP